MGVTRWIAKWEADIEHRCSLAWKAFMKLYGQNSTYREWTVFLTGWRMAMIAKKYEKN
jgi:hypothetical protein